jgi:hypothetical protein
MEVEYDGSLPLGSRFRYKNITTNSMVFDRFVGGLENVEVVDLRIRWDFHFNKGD